MEVSADAHSEVTADKKNMTARCSEELSSAHQPEDLDSATFSFVIKNSESFAGCSVQGTQYYESIMMYPKPVIRILLFPNRDSAFLQRSYNFRA